jgi:hypothetical protein
MLQLAERTLMTKNIESVTNISSTAMGLDADIP